MSIRSSLSRKASWAGLAASLSATAYLFTTKVLDWSSGAGPSMIPTFAAEESITVISRLHRNGRSLRVGDIIHAKSPIFLHQRVAKRVIGMPGDYVVFDRDQDRTVGGAPFPGQVRASNVLTNTSEDADADAEDDWQRGRKEPQMIQVPEGHVWVVGDNMGWSRDSRFYGALPMALIVGKVIAYREPGTWFGFHWYGSGDQLKSVDDVD